MRNITSTFISVGVWALCILFMSVVMGDPLSDIILPATIGGIIGAGMWYTGARILEKIS